MVLRPRQSASERVCSAVHIKKARLLQAGSKALLRVPKHPSAYFAPNFVLTPTRKRVSVLLPGAL
jgi:hypothetical protein